MPSMWVANVRDAVKAGECYRNIKIVEQLQEALAPTKEFRRIHPVQSKDHMEISWEKVPVRTVDPQVRRRAELPKELVQTKDQGWKLVDVLDGTIDLDTFTAQLSDEDLIEIFRGEGMCSPKVTAGTAACLWWIDRKSEKLWNSGSLLCRWTIRYSYGLWNQSIFPSKRNCAGMHL